MFCTRCHYYILATEILDHVLDHVEQFMSDQDTLNTVTASLTAAFPAVQVAVAGPAPLDFSGLLSIAQQYVDLIPAPVEEDPAPTE